MMYAEQTFMKFIAIFDRYEDVNILRAYYFVLLYATLGAWQAHGMSMHLILPALDMCNE